MILFSIFYNHFVMMIFYPKLIKTLFDNSELIHCSKVLSICIALSIASPSSFG